MPCNGVTVVTAEVMQQRVLALGEGAADWTVAVLELLKEHVVRITRLHDGMTVAIQAMLPFGTTKMPVRIALDRRMGKITAITDAGNYAEGLELLKEWIAMLSKNGVQVKDGFKAEMHRHGNQPKLAYTEPIYAH